MKTVVISKAMKFLYKMTQPKINKTLEKPDINI